MEVPEADQRVLLAGAAGEPKCLLVVVGSLLVPGLHLVDVAESDQGSQPVSGIPPRDPSSPAGPNGLKPV